MPDIDPDALFDYLTRVDSEVRGNLDFRSTLRWGNDYLAVGWLNHLAYCEYKFEVEWGVGAAAIGSAIAALPSDVRAAVIDRMGEHRDRLEEGIGNHNSLEAVPLGRDFRTEFNVSAPYVGLKGGSPCCTVLVGRIDHLSLDRGRLHVLDWKTGDAPYRDDPWNGDVLQVLAYCWVLRCALRRHPVYRTLPLTATIEYTQNGRRYSVDYDSSGSVVRPGFSQFRTWSQFTPSQLMTDRLDRLWSYWSGERAAQPVAEHNREAKCRGCEYAHVGCPHSPFRVG